MSTTSSVVKRNRIDPGTKVHLTCSLLCGTEEDAIVGQKAELFSPHPQTKNGFHTQCKACRTKQMREVNARRRKDALPTAESAPTPEIVVVEAIPMPPVEAIIAIGPDENFIIPAPEFSMERFFEMLHGDPALQRELAQMLASAIPRPLDSPSGKTFFVEVSTDRNGRKNPTAINPDDIAEMVFDDAANLVEVLYKEEVWSGGYYARHSQVYGGDDALRLRAALGSALVSNRAMEDLMAHAHKTESNLIQMTASRDYWKRKYDALRKSMQDDLREKRRKLMEEENDPELENQLIG